MYAQFVPAFAATHCAPPVAPKRRGERTHRYSYYTQYTPYYVYTPLHTVHYVHTVTHRTLCVVGCGILSPTCGLRLRPRHGLSAAYNIRSMMEFKCKRTRNKSGNEVYLSEDS